MSTVRKDVLGVAVEFKNSMKKAGKGFKFAKAKDITDTYHYRWFNSFVDKCYRNGLDLDGAKEVVRSMVVFAKDNGILNKGAALLSRSDIIDVCIRKIEKDDQDIDEHLITIKESLSTIDVNNPVRMLIKKQHRHGSHNIVLLRDRNKLPDFFISLSKSCMKAVCELKSDDLLSIREYYLMRMKMINKFGDDTLREIMGDEYNG